ncbi:hypothetical protein EV426DRAFT_584650 [Tirmania nivea]|nr:hypothetical protein EV426DRAFT_584650 [Tirmania nivea]
MKELKGKKLDLDGGDVVIGQRPNQRVVPLTTIGSTKASTIGSTKASTVGSATRKLMPLLSISTIQGTAYMLGKKDLVAEVEEESKVEDRKIEIVGDLVERRVYKEVEAESKVEDMVAEIEEERKVIAKVAEASKVEDLIEGMVAEVDMVEGVEMVTRVDKDTIPAVSASRQHLYTPQNDAIIHAKNDPLMELKTAKQVKVTLPEIVFRKVLGRKNGNMKKDGNIEKNGNITKKRSKTADCGEEAKTSVKLGIGVLRDVFEKAHGEAQEDKEDEDIQALVQILRIHHHLSTPDYQQSNGKIERVVASIKFMLKRERRKRK